MDRRDVLMGGASMLAATATGCAQVPAGAREKPPFVLVHGAFHGGWCWARVAERLRAAGHRVYTPTLTGMGERSHLIGPDVNLETHIQDVVNVIEYEELERVVLVCHSYAGIVGHGVADRANPRLGGLVFFDSVLPDYGKSWSDYNTPQVVAQRRAEVDARGKGYIWKPEQSAAGYGISEPADVALFNRRVSAYPFAAYLQKLEQKGPGLGTLPLAYIDCIKPALAPINQFRMKARTNPRFKVFPLEAGHDGMLTHPAEVASILLSLA